VTLKTFNLDEETYKEFSKHCKANGISMSKKVENFIKNELSQLKSPIEKEIVKEENHTFGKFC